MFWSVLKERGDNLSELKIKDFIKEVGENNVAHGFRDRENSFCEFIALIHSEVSEMLEEHREGKYPTETYYTCKAKTRSDCRTIFPGVNTGCKGCEFAKPEGIPYECADAVIRLFDFADFYKIDLESAIIEKMNFNKTRPHMHGKTI